MAPSYYQRSIEETIRELKTHGQKGLSSQQVNERRRMVGENCLPDEGGVSMAGLILNQFNDFMVLILFGATFFSTLLGHFDDAVVILGIVIVNALLGFIQEFRAEGALQNLKRLSAPLAQVIREGEQHSVMVEELVPGDLICLEAGGHIPADARIISSSHLKVDESSLTGESEAVLKSSAPLSQPVSLGDRTSMVYRGTILVEGRGRALVTETGKRTEMGRIAHLIQREKEGLTPLQWRLKRLGFFLVGLCSGACLLVVLVGLGQGKSIYQMLMAGVSLAVAAIPEGLPAIVTLSLALGVQRMISRRAIVRHLPAVETLGCATVICADKTGTLTQNSMQVVVVYYNDETHQTLHPGLSLPLRTALLCNNSTWKGGEWVGDPTEVALLKGALVVGLGDEEYEREEEIPFSPERKMMSVVVKGGRGREVHSKGAPQALLNRCSHYLLQGEALPLTPSIEERVLKVAQGWAQKSLRVLALASCPDPHASQPLEEGLTFLGLVGLMDPPRPEVKEAIRCCYQAGIRPIMITGDHPETAQAIAREIGLQAKDSQILTGEELMELTDAELFSCLEDIHIFARITPEGKLRLVKAYQKQGQVVAMTGDGINDAPAVKAADIGIAMGRMGTDVTREVSSLVLLDDNFATIVGAVEEGRGIYENIKKCIRYLLSCNIGEILLVLFAMILGLPLPLLPIQILWVNLVTDGLPALALSMEKPEPDLMDAPPRDPGETLFAHGLTVKILLQGTVIGLFTLFLFLYSLTIGRGIEESRTMAFTALVAYQLLFAFRCRLQEKSLWHINIFGNPYLLMAVFLSFSLHLFILYHPLFSSLFQTIPPSLFDWVLLVPLSLGAILLVDGLEYLMGSVFFLKIQEVMGRL